MALVKPTKFALLAARQKRQSAPLSRPEFNDSRPRQLASELWASRLPLYCSSSPSCSATDLLRVWVRRLTPLNSRVMTSRQG